MTAALIIAAGATQAAEDFAPMKPVGNLSAVRRLIRIFQQAGASRIVLVAGQDIEKLKRHIARMDVVCLENPNYANTEMFDSVKIGLEYLKGKCDKVQITPVDIPLFSVDTVMRLAESDEPVVLPIHEGETGHPLQIAAALFDKIIAYDGAGGLAGAVDSLGLSRCFLEVRDAGILLDVEKSDDYDELLAQHSLSALIPLVKLLITRDGLTYGPGSHHLLHLVDETQSLRLACQQMGISYSKGWKMINALEEMFGYNIVVRQQGGRHGGKSETTQKGKELLANYDAFVEDVKGYAEAAFENYFGKQ